MSNATAVDKPAPIAAGVSLNVDGFGRVREPARTLTELGAGLFALAAAIRTIEPLFHHLGELASACRGLANATAMSVIAQHGTNEDRAAAVAHLKGWFEEFGK